MKFIYFLLTSVLIIMISCKDWKERKADERVKEFYENLEKESRFQNETILMVGTEMLDVIGEDYPVIQGDSVFKYNDTMYVALYYPAKFKSTKLLMRFYKEGRIRNSYSVTDELDVPVQPEGEFITNNFPASILYDANGKGKYKMGFILKDSTIASKEFILQ